MYFVYLINKAISFLNEGGGRIFTAITTDNTKGSRLTPWTIARCREGATQMSFQWMRSRGERRCHHGPRGSWRTSGDPRERDAPTSSPTPIPCTDMTTLPRGTQQRRSPVWLRPPITHAPSYMINLNVRPILCLSLYEGLFPVWCDALHKIKIENQG